MIFARKLPMFKNLSKAHCCIRLHFILSASILYHAPTSPILPDFMIHIRLFELYDMMTIININVKLNVKHYASRYADVDPPPSPNYNTR